MKDILKRSWVEIDLGQIERNYKLYKASIGSGKRIMAVVKADAYGHGECQVAKKLNELGVMDFAVSNLDEACSLRNAGVLGNILILGYTPVTCARILYENDITQAIISEEYATQLVKEGLPIKCNIAIDTGMSRIGLSAKNIDDCRTAIYHYASKLNVTGIFTHLCVADSLEEASQNFTLRQLELFEEVLESVSALNLKYNHCLNSAGGLWYESKYTDIVRLGIILYGLKPDYLNVLPTGIRPALQWKSTVAMVKWIDAGDTIGYGRTYTAKRRMKIATIPTGYADGYDRRLSNRGFVFINGSKANIVGRICMDQFMVDISDIDGISIGTEVSLIGDNGNLHYSADDMAHDLNTIGYEIVCKIGKRVPRIYIS